MIFREGRPVGMSGKDIRNRESLTIGFQLKFRVFHHVVPAKMGPITSYK